MSESFEKAKALLTEKGSFTKDDVDKITAEHGELTHDELMWLESEKHRLERAKDETITMEQYLEAAKILDTVAEGSDEYKKAEEIVEKYERGH